MSDCDHIIGAFHPMDDTTFLLVHQSDMAEVTLLFNFCPKCGLPLNHPATQHEKLGARVEGTGKDEADHFIGRLQTVIELLNAGEIHMAVAKLLADISVLKGIRDGQ